MFNCLMTKITVGSFAADNNNSLYRFAVVVILKSLYVSISTGESNLLHLPSVFTGAGHKMLGDNLSDRKGTSKKFTH